MQGEPAPQAAAWPVRMNGTAWLVVAAAVAAFVVFKVIRMRQVSAEAHRWVEAGATLVDVRSPQEFAAGHLPQAKNIPVQELDRRAKELGDRGKPLVVYCRSGARSASAKGSLVAQGFTQVLDLGPMSAW